MTKNKTITKLAVGLAVLVLAAASALASSPLSRDWPIGIDGGGGEMPTPFQILNQRVELADGEFYILEGQVVSLQLNGVDTPYLAIDLQEQSWLANNYRQNFPYYQLEGTWDYWNQFKGKTVKLSCRARYLGQGSKTQGPLFALRILNRESVTQP
jgi:hypothetical protein